MLNPALENSPCTKLFGIVIKLDKFSRELLTPLLIGFGKVLKAEATGLNIS